MREWFIAFVIWLSLLCWVAVWALEQNRSLWLGAVFLFYMSLCCTFFPLPTSWIVMLLASKGFMLVPNAALCVLLIATLGALATATANLNEYHIWTYVLQYRTVGRIRETRLFRWAGEKFYTSPFAVLVGFSFIPVPVDVVRWLAVACRYPRPRFFAAYFVGRWIRYGLLALSTVWLDLLWWHILILQGVLVLLAATKVVSAHWARKRSAARGSAP